MGYKQSPALIVAALLLLTPLAYATLLPTFPTVPRVGSSIFSGILCCTPTGNCSPGSTRLPGVAVNLNCTNLVTGAQSLIQGATNSLGAFNIILPISTGGLLNLPIAQILTCNVVVNLPLNSTICPVLSTVDGIITSVPTLVNTLLNGLLGPLFVFVFQLFRVVTITT